MEAARPVRELVTTGSMCAVSYEVGDRLEGYALTRRLSTGFGHATLIHCLALA